MRSFKALVVVASASAVAMVLPASAKECPPPVKAAVEKAHPGATVVGCKEENEDGVVQYAVKIAIKDGKNLAMDVSPEGKVLSMEERVALNQVPAAVMESLTEKYPGAKATSVEKQTGADGKVVYEIVFESGKEKKSAVFYSDGALAEEEEEGEEEGDE